MATGTIMLLAAGGKPTTTNGCAEPQVVEAGTNDVDYWVLDFDKDTDEFAFWGPIPMPADWDGGATIKAQYYWTTTGGASAQTVTWGIQLAARDNDDPIEDAWGTIVTVADTWIANGDIHKVKSGNITADTTGTRAGEDLLFARTFRDVSADDLGADARLIAIKLEFTTT